MTKKVIIIDIDDTLINSHHRLNCLFPNAKPQTSYRLPKEHFDAFAQSDFYTNVYYNQALVNYINNQKDDIQLIVISKSPNNVIYYSKNRIIKKIFPDIPYQFVHLSPIPKTDIETNWITQTIHQIINDYSHIKEFECFDDSPVRLNTYLDIQSTINNTIKFKIWRIPQPYNKHITTDEDFIFINSQETISDI